MATLNDIAVLVPRLLDDHEVSVFDTEFILPYVNSAQTTIVQRLQACGVQEARFRATSFCLPASTTSIGRNRATVIPQNLLPSSASFAFGAAPAWDDGAYDTPVVGTFTTGGPTASGEYSELVFAAASAHEMTKAATVAFTNGLTTQYVTVAVWLAAGAAATPFTATVSAGINLANETAVSTNIDSRWQRVVVTAGPFTISSASSFGTIRIGFPNITSLSVKIAQAQISYTISDPGYAATGVSPLSATPTPTLPTNLVVPDELWEAKIGGTNQDYFRMIGPIQLPAIAQTNNLGYWDFYDDTIHFLGCTEDRLVRIDYYGSLPDFDENTSEPVLLRSGVNPISYLCAAQIATARAQHQLAESLSNMATLQIEDIVRIETKMQQQQPERRQPYRGRGRYQGYFRGAY